MVHLEEKEYTAVKLTMGRKGAGPRCIILGAEVPPAVRANVECSSRCISNCTIEIKYSISCRIELIYVAISLDTMKNRSSWRKTFHAPCRFRDKQS